jgi:hypothetical protein
MEGSNSDEEDSGSAVCLRCQECAPKLLGDNLDGSDGHSDFDLA